MCIGIEEICLVLSDGPNLVRDSGLPFFSTGGRTYGVTFT